MRDDYKKGEITYFQEVFDFIENILTKNDEEQNGLILVGFIESLQNLSSHEDFGYEVFEKYLKPLGFQGWRQIEALWEGNHL